MSKGFTDPVLLLLARFVRDLCTIPEAQIVPGRANAERANFDSDLVVLDNLGPDTALASGQVFDDTTESLAYSERAQRAVTLDFYGPSAHTRAANFRMLCRSEASSRLQDSLGITVFHPSRVTDVRALTGEAWQARLQVEIMVGYSHGADVATLRIDTATLAAVTEE